MNELQTSFAKKFQCIGGECSLTCCHGMRVGVDEETYHKYENMDHPFAKKVLDSIEKNKDGYFFAKVNKDCSLLDEHKLCSVYTELGEENFCHICATYPRVHFDNESYSEKCVAITCPEVVRLLRAESQVQFFYESEDKNAEGIALPADEKFQFLFLIRNKIIDILQCKEIPLNNRVRIVIYLIEKINAPIVDNDFEKVLNIMGMFESQDEWKQMSDLMKGLTFSVDHREGILLEQIRCVAHFKCNDELMEKSRDLAIAYNKKHGDNEHYSVIERILEETEELENFGENYFVYYIYRFFIKSALQEEEEALSNKMKLMLSEYSIMRFFVGLWIEEVGSAENVPIDAIVASCARVFENSIDLGELLLKYFTSRELNKFPNVLALI